MGTYLVHRLLLMIPTLFGITVVSFVIMQLVPGDPVANRFERRQCGARGRNPRCMHFANGELHLDKPLLLNFNYFRDYRPDSPLGGPFYERARPNRFGRSEGAVREAKDPAAIRKRPSG